MVLFDRVHEMHVDICAGQAAANAVPVAAQAQQIMIEPQDAAIGVDLGPIERIAVREKAVFEKFLALQEHRNARRRQGERRGEGRAFLG